MCLLPPRLPLRRASRILLICGLVAVALCPAAVDRESAAEEHFSLTVDGVHCGPLRSVQGGGMSADVVSSGGGAFEKKQLARPHYNPIEVQLSFAAGKPVYDWINASWKGNPQRRSGSITAADPAGRTQWETQFQNALLTETTIPALDASSKEPGYLALDFLPERITEHKGPVPGGAAAPAASGGDAKAAAKHFIVSNFRLEIDGVDCSRVLRIDSFTVRQEPAAAPAGGEAREVSRQPSKLQFPNLLVTLASTGPTADSWQQWAEDFIINGRGDERHERTGTITLLGPDMTSIVARVRFYNTGICRFERTRAGGGGGPSIASGDPGQRMTAELYVERMELEAAGAGEQDRPAPTPPGKNPVVQPRTRVPARG